MNKTIIRQLIKTDLISKQYLGGVEANSELRFDLDQKLVQLTVKSHHLNQAQVCHGGVLLAVADITAFMFCLDHYLDQHQGLSLKDLTLSTKQLSYSFDRAVKLGQVVSFKLAKLTTHISMVIS